MIRLTLITAIILAALSLTACTDRRGETAPVPRPAAYPRIADPGTDYVTADSLPVSLPVNAAAIISRPRPDWLDITYPSLRVTVHLSITTVAPGELESAIANRSQRIALNIGDGASPVETTIESDDFTSVIISSPESRSTPLQFLAHDSDRRVVSGAAFFSDASPSASIDSLAPVVSIIERDLVYALSKLRNR